MHVQSLKANSLYPFPFMSSWTYGPIDRLTPILVDAFPPIDNFNKLFQQTSETINVFWLVQYATI